jgi:hypothetical protein
MITAKQCADYAGLAQSEIILGAVPSFKQQSLLSNYLLNLARGPDAVREMIVSDLRGCIGAGDRRRAADLLVVLSILFSEYPEARMRTRQSIALKARL